LQHAGVRVLDQVRLVVEEVEVLPRGGGVVQTLQQLQHFLV